jgi:NADPH:quinone reductase
MKAWLLDGYDGIASIHLADVPDLRPGPGEVVVQMRYAGLNPADAYLAQKLYPAKPTFPHVLGREGLGTIASIGTGVTGRREGEEVVILPGAIGADRWGTFAQQVVVPAEEVVPAPAGWDTQTAAAGILVYLTAWQALTQWGALPEKPVALVTGASGGVGSATVQLAACQGWPVVALTRSDAKAQVLRELGATMVCNSARRNWPKLLKQELGQRRVNIAVDNVGGSLFRQVIEMMGMNGVVSVVGRLAGPVPQFNTATLFFRRLKIGGVAVSTWTPEQMRTEWKRIQELLNQGNRRPVVDQVFPMEQLPQAFERLAQGPVGKVLVEVR